MRAWASSLSFAASVAVPHEMVTGIAAPSKRNSCPSMSLRTFSAIRFTPS
jgi:hypothetical protein